MVEAKDAALKKAVESITEGARKFEVENTETGKTQEYYLVMPNADEIKSSQWEYAKTYNMALREGIFTSEELIDILKRRNIIGDEYDKKLEKLQQSLREKLLELEISEDKEERVELATAASDIRAEMIRWNARFIGPMNSTCENLANEARNDYLTSVVVRDKDGGYVWDNLDAYANEKDVDLYLKARFQVSLWMEGLDPGFLENEPDQVVLKEFEKEEIEKLEQAVAEAEKAEEEKAKEKAAVVEKRKKVVKKKTDKKPRKARKKKE